MKLEELEGKQSSANRFYNEESYMTFRELMHAISDDWGFDKKNLQKDGYVFWINKTMIGKDFVSYKTSHSYLAPGIFEKLERFYELLEED